MDGCGGVKMCLNFFPLSGDYGCHFRILIGALAVWFVRRRGIVLLGVEVGHPTPLSGAFQPRYPGGFF